MSKRLRFEDISVKPRIYIDGDSFRVEYYGPITKGHCGAGFKTLADAIEHGNKVARRNPVKVKAINDERARARNRRIATRQAERLGLPVAA
ncbi:hypothetical protein [Paenarthrobacter sp. YJN-5]|uniref:hypothetical protein n=1 Tax=Paenarthrobacter sp. YJN-5 TaxID=2735316 RepID=UPI001878FBAC|nr:hypothetical protein [Paenarthrobacter sp. YJN-5]QOT15913.1 hypothetical protein HMI59_04445 [Paenarthrobacter sp. YJN-5]